MHNYLAISISLGFCLSTMLLAVPCISADTESNVNNAKEASATSSSGLSKTSKQTSLSQAAPSQTNSSNNQQSVIGNDATANTTNSTNVNQNINSQPLQAGVQLIELNLQVLHDIGLDIKSMMKAAGSIYDEVNIRPVSIVTEPEVIGRGIIINIPVSTQDIGPPAPPRKHRLDIALGQLTPIVKLAKQDVDDFEAGRRRLDISDDERGDLAPYFKQWVDLILDISSQTDNLVNLCQGPKFDNQAISDSASSVHDDAKKLDDIRRKLYKYLQKEGKKKKQKQSS